MKKLLFCVLALLASVTASAQDMMWGLTGGLNVSTFNGSDFSSKAGFNIGLKAEYNIADPFFVEGSVLLSQKGAKYEILNEKMKMDLWYLHVPMNFGYKFDINDLIAVAPKVGIFLGCGLWGSDDNDNNPFTDYSKGEFEYLGMKDFNRFDFGFGFGVNGYVAKHLELSTGYEISMVKAYNNDTKPRNWYLNLAFMF